MEVGLRRTASRAVALTARPALVAASALAFLVAPAAEAGPAPAAPAAALPFAAGGSALDHSRAVQCLTYAIYYEAGNQPEQGQRAVAQVVLNRVRNPTFPRTVCGVVFQGAKSRGCQFTFACDGSMARRPDAAAWRRAEGVAQDALAGTVMAQVGVATYYHADYVFPNWSSLAKTAKVGAHIFFARPNEGLSALAARYAGGEPFVDVHSLIPSEAAPPPPDLIDVLDFEAHPIVEPHSADDVGGRVQLGHGWSPVAPPAGDDAMARILAAQGG